MKKSDGDHKADILAYYHTSRFRFFWHYIVFLIIIGAGWFVYQGGLEQFQLRILQDTVLIFYGLVGIAVLYLILIELVVRSNRIVIREGSMSVDIGFLSKHTTQINYTTITDINVYQSLLQRLFRYGDIEIGVPGSMVQQTIQNRFSGKGDVKIEHSERRHGRPKETGFIFRRFQNVRMIERLILSRIGKLSAHEHS